MAEQLACSIYLALLLPVTYSEHLILGVGVGTTKSPWANSDPVANTGSISTSMFTTTTPVHTTGTTASSVATIAPANSGGDYPAPRSDQYDSGLPDDYYNY